jgi:hypothetical protein
MTESPAPGSAEPPKIDTSVPHSARIWNYWLGGRDNYPVDQEIGAQYRATFPGIVDVARTSRYFLARAVRYLAGEALTPASCTSTTTRWCSCMPGPC